MDKQHVESTSRPLVLIIDFCYEFKNLCNGQYEEILAELVSLSHKDECVS